MTQCFEMGLVNPASQHRSGRQARRVLEECREKILGLLGANSRAPRQDRLVFTSGGTESNNLAIHGLLAAHDVIASGEAGQSRGNVVISAIEHPSVLEPAERLPSCGYELRHLPVSPGGHVLLDALEPTIDADTRLVCVMYANNELGTIQPIREIANYCDARSIPLHCDAVQVAGKLPIDFHELGVSTLTFSAHKFHGPRGIGGLLVRHGVQLRPFLLGGSQQLGTRPGTENVASAVGMAKALELMLNEGSTEARGESSWAEQIVSLRDLLETTILANSNAQVIGVSPRMPHATNLAFPGIDRQALVMALDLAGVECSTGSACSSGSSEPSHVVVATGADPTLIRGSIRLSLDANLTSDDILLAAERILDVVRGMTPGK